MSCGTATCIGQSGRGLLLWHIPLVLSYKLSSLVMLPYLYSRCSLIPATSGHVARRFFTFEAGDFCMLREMRSNRKYLIGPLEQGMQKDHKGGRINHEDLMGKPIRSIVRTHNGNGIILFKSVINEGNVFIDAYGFMLHKPTLEEYVLNVPRACTPVYTKDASSIVSSSMQRMI